jgi:hypothetical protein
MDDDIGRYRRKRNFITLKNELTTGYDQEKQVDPIIEQIQTRDGKRERSVVI